MSRKVKTYTYNVSCGVDVAMMKAINAYSTGHQVCRSQAIRHILQRGMNAMDAHACYNKEDKINE